MDNISRRKVENIHHIVPTNNRKKKEKETSGTMVNKHKHEEIHGKQHTDSWG